MLKLWKNKYIKKHNKNKLKTLIHLFNILTESEVQNTAVPSKEANLDYKIIKELIIIIIIIIIIINYIPVIKLVFLGLISTELTVFWWV
mgnify:CR=1 FL=1